MGWIPKSFSPIQKVSQREKQYNFAQDINVQGMNLHREGWQQVLCLGNCQAGGATGPLNRTLMPPLPPVGAIPKGPGGPCGTPDAPLTPPFITSCGPLSVEPPLKLRCWPTLHNTCKSQSQAWAKIEPSKVWQSCTWCEATMTKMRADYETQKPLQWARREAHHCTMSQKAATNTQGGRKIAD